MSELDAIQSELEDILPSYIKYKQSKIDFERNKIAQDVPITYMKRVCKEIKEFIEILYSGTNTMEERNIIRNMIDDLKEVF